MENRINQIIVLEDGLEYYILKQAIYKKDNYFLVAEVNNDGNEIKDSFIFLHEGKENGESFIEIEENPEIIQILLKYLNIKEG